MKQKESCLTVNKQKEKKKQNYKFNHLVKMEREKKNYSWNE